jgi:SNF family Na+-dependent transporter
MYLTATFPYAVTTIFLIRSIMLDGAMDGLAYMLNPDVSCHALITLYYRLSHRGNFQLTRLYDPEVWLDAATQIFYSMGLGFGGELCLRHSLVHHFPLIVHA